MQGLFYNSTTSNSIVLSENGRSVLWVQLVMAVLSIVGSGSIILFALFQNLLGTHEARSLVFLNLADFLLCFTWLIGAVLLNPTCDNHNACYNLHATEQVFYMSSFFYTLNYAWALYMRLKQDYCRNVTVQSTVFPGKSEGRCSLAKMAAALSFVLPVLLMVPVLVVGNSSSCSRNLSQSYECLLMHTWELHNVSEASACRSIHTYSITVFVITFAGSLTGVLALMAKAHCLYTRCVASAAAAMDAREWAGLQALRRQMLLNSTAFAACWTPAALLAVLFPILNRKDLLYVILYILQAFLSPSQGWLNCLLYGWTQQRSRSLRALQWHDAYTQTPLLRSQKQTTHSKARA